MSTTSSNISSASATVARNEDFARRLEGLDSANLGKMHIYLTKLMVKEAGKKTRVKREPKLDEEGNIVKRPLPEGAKVWNANVSQFKNMLTEYLKNEATERGEDANSVKVSHKACMRLCSILKEKAGALGAGEENTFYPVENLTEEVMAGLWEQWNSLPEEEKFPKKGATEESDKEDGSTASDSEAEKPKRGRPSKAKVVATPVDSEVEEAPKPAPKAVKAKAKAEVASEPTPAPAPAPAKGKGEKVTAPVADGREATLVRSVTANHSEAEAESAPAAKKVVVKKGKKAAAAVEE